MALNNEDPARCGAAPGPDGVLLGSGNRSESTKSPSTPQAISIRKELLRDFVVEALSVAAHYSDTAVTFAQIGDIDCMELAIREFARTATLATKTARELVDLRNGVTS